MIDSYISWSIEAFSLSRHFSSGYPLFGFYGPEGHPCPFGHPTIEAFYIWARYIDGPLYPASGRKHPTIEAKFGRFSAESGQKVPLGSNETTYLLIWPRIPLYFPVSLWYHNGPNEWKLGINPTPVGFRRGGAANQWGASTLSDKLIGYFNHGLGFQLKTWICINWMYAWVVITMDSRLDKLRIERNCLK